MATRTNRVEVEITASDEATSTIERLEKKIDGLEADEARITVSANTERLQGQLDTARAKLEGLDGDEASVQARLVGNLEESLDQAETLLRELDGKTGTVRITANAEDAISDLDRVETRLRQLDGETATVRVDSPAGGLGVGDAAGAIGGAASVGAAIELGRQQTDLAFQVGQVAEATGATLEKASSTVQIWRNQGFEVADLLGILNQVNDVLRDQPELAERLGINLKDNDDLITNFTEAVAGVGREFDNNSERAAVMNQLLGEEGVLQVGRLTQAIDTDLATAIANTEPIVKQSDIDNAKTLNAQIVQMKSDWDKFKSAVAEELIPVAVSNRHAGTFDVVINQQIDRILRAVFGPSPVTQPNPGLSAVAARNVLGYSAAPDQSLIAGAPGVRGANVTIVNPPGTPPATVDLSRLYDERNGSRS